MRLTLHGGFGEKGRTCACLESAGYRVLLDAGVKTSARGSIDYYPAISADELCATNAIIVTHAHEDHVAGLGWCIANGFHGKVFMTAETWREADSSLLDYATSEEYKLARGVVIERLPVGMQVLELGPIRLSTGRSGHMGGCVWCCFDDGRVRLIYCGDIVPASPVFAMDGLPRSDAIVIDASYGDDNATLRERTSQIAGWIEAHPQGCILPTPLHGRSAELLAIIECPLALAPGMRDALATQLDGEAWLVPGISDALAKRLATAADWQPGHPFPRAALLCHDGMGIRGPSRALLTDATRLEHPTLFTGHLPKNSPGEEMVAHRRAGWIRLPTHPTLAENRALVAASGAMIVVGHSCDETVLERLQAHLPQLDTTLAIGDLVEI
ncbi:MAG: MBL fold metallo-hydrolase [Casimicrobiaceae bacterium]